jgi:TPP-dependent pyruvate/acetoin dehydrogenase alpha subunit
VCTKSEHGFFLIVTGACKVLLAVRAARDHISANGTPAMVEALTYRVGNHSTSDESTRYTTDHDLDKGPQWLHNLLPIW